MYHHVKKLMYTVRVDDPDPRFGNMLLEQFGGANGELAAAMQRVAPVSLRVNPDVDAKTHPYISTGLKENKFGIDIETAYRVYQRAAQMPNIRITGIDCHIGSQLTTIAPYLDAIERLLVEVQRLHRKIAVLQIEPGVVAGQLPLDERHDDVDVIGHQHAKTHAQRRADHTDQRTLDVVVAVLAGRINTRFVAAINAAGGAYANKDILGVG